MGEEQVADRFDFTLVRTYLHISPEGSEDTIAELPARDLLDAEKLLPVMTKAGDAVQAEGLQLPASFMGTSLCNLIIMKLFHLAQDSVLIDLSLDKLTFQVEQHDDHTHLGYRIDDLTFVEVAADGGEEAVLLADTEQFVKTWITPAVEAIAKAANEQPAMIWLQFGGLLATPWGFLQQHEQREDVLERFNRYFELMREGLSPEWFNARRNPFQWKIRYTDSPYEPGQQLIMRSACCHYDCRQDGEKCYVCPRLTEEERSVMKEKIQAAM